MKKKKIEQLMSIHFKSETTYDGDDGKYIKTKIKTYKDNVTTNFYNKKISEERVPHKCLSIIILESLLYTYEKYYPQKILECKYAKEKIKTDNYIDTELESESDIDSDIYIDTDNEE